MPTLVPPRLGSVSSKRPSEISIPRWFNYYSLRRMDRRYEIDCILDPDIECFVILKKKAQAHRATKHDRRRALLSPNQTRQISLTPPILIAKCTKLREFPRGH